MMKTPATEEQIPVVDVEACCPPFLQEPISADDAVLAARLFRALGEPARVRLLSLIAAHGPDGVCVCYLVEPLGLSQPTVSHHLKVLHEAGLVSREKRGTWAYYRLRDDAVGVLSQALCR